MPPRPPRPSGATAGVLPAVPDWGFESRAGRRGQHRQAASRTAPRGDLVAHAVRRAWRCGRLRCLGGARQPGLGLCGRPARVPPARGRCRVRRTSRGTAIAGPSPITRYPGVEVSGVHRATLDAFAAMGVPAVADHNAPHAIGAGPMPMSTRDGRRATSVDGYLPRDRRPPGLTVMPDAPVGSVVLACRPGDGRAARRRDGSSAPTGSSSRRAPTGARRS